MLLCRVVREFPPGDSRAVRGQRKVHTRGRVSRSSRAKSIAEQAEGMRVTVIARAIWSVDSRMSSPNGKACDDHHDRRKLTKLTRSEKIPPISAALLIDFVDERGAGWGWGMIPLWRG